MFDHTPFAVHFHRPITLVADLAVLYVEMLQAPTIKCDVVQSIVADPITVADTQLLQVRTTLREHFQPRIAYVTRSYVDRTQPTATGDARERVVANRLAASRIQITKFVTPPCDHRQASVCYEVALGHRQVAQLGSEFGQFVEAEVGHFHAIGDAQLPK